MTPFQLLVSAQAPCSRTMVGLGPALAATRLVVRAEAVWLSGMIRAAVAITKAEIIRASLARRAVLAVFTVISFSGGPSVRLVALDRALKKSPPAPTVRRNTGGGVSGALLHL